MKIRIQLAQGQQAAFVRTGRRFTADRDGCVEVEEFSQDHYDLLSQGAAVFVAGALRRRGPGTPEIPAPPSPPVEPPVPPVSDDGGTVTDPEVPSPPAPPVEPPVPPETDGGVVTNPEPFPGGNTDDPTDPVVPPPAEA